MHELCEHLYLDDGTEKFFYVYRLEEDVSPLKEGGDRFTVGTLRACSYKAKAEGWHQGLYPHTLQGFLWFLFLSYNSFTRNSLSLLDKRDFRKSPKQAQRFSDGYTITPVGVCINHKEINNKNTLLL